MPNKRHAHKVRRRSIRRYRADVKKRTVRARKLIGRYTMMERALYEALQPPRGVGVVMLP